MKQGLLILFFFILCGCATEKSVELTDGTCITERKYQRILKQTYREAMRELSKEEKNIIRSITIETSE
ncbi:MAG: hypothetical protein LW688_02905 [Cryomorphaceae bacterium]|jgi:hypothetical protein|nr:hypothetical protein [Cryomorphaceae bacterium]